MYQLGKLYWLIKDKSIGKGAKGRNLVLWKTKIFAILCKILEKYLNLKPKKDWIGRIYGIINPNLDINGNMSWSNTIIELDDDNTNSDAYVKAWIYKQMNMVKYVFKLDESGFFDYIGCDITHVGPKEHDNFLVVFYIVSQKAFLQNLKKLLKHILVYIVLVAIIFGICLVF